MNDESPFFQRIIVYSIIDLVFVLLASSRTMFQLSNQVKSNLDNLHNCHGFSTFYLGPLHLECCISQFVTIGGTVIRSHILIQVCAHFNLVKSRCPRPYLLIEPFPRKSHVTSEVASVHTFFILFLWCNRIHCIWMEWQDPRKQQSHGRTWVWPARNIATILSSESCIQPGLAASRGNCWFRDKVYWVHILLRTKMNHGLGPGWSRTIVDPVAGMSGLDYYWGTLFGMMGV